MTVNDECKLSLAPIGRARNALPLGNGGGSRNPGKRVEIASVQFLPTSFLRKLAVFLLPTFDAPSMALSVCEWVEIAWSLAGHGVPDTVENGLCSRIEKKLFFRFNRENFYSFVFEFFFYGCNYLPDFFDF